MEGFISLGLRHDLRETTQFGSNPGNLRMFVRSPATRRKKAALVVVLHGCLQTAKGYDTGSGWSAIADTGEFVLLYPEQQKSNNPRACFNWFNPEDCKRDSGEACSIRAMIDTAVRDHRIDENRIFITGLSAGGAMAGAMLATYPEIFKAGAIIAGLPYGAASTVQDAMQCMFTGRTQPPRVWGDLVREASRHTGPWPTISIWHGMADATVKPINAGELVKQWTNVHALTNTAAVETRLGETLRRDWRDADGTSRVIEYAVPGMGHGTPLSGLTGADDGVVGPYFLSAGIGSTLQIASDWGLIDGRRKKRKAPRFSFLGFRF